MFNAYVLVNLGDPNSQVDLQVIIFLTIERPLTRLTRHHSDSLEIQQFASENRLFDNKKEAGSSPHPPIFRV